MQPVMLVCRTRLIFVIVALSLEALLTVVTSAKPEAGATSGSEGLDPHATKSSRRQFNQSISSQEGVSAMSKSAGNHDSSVNTRHRNNSMAMIGASRAEPQPWTESIISSSSSFGGNADNSQKPDETSSSVWSEDIQVGCKELRARSYITDGFCTSEKPVQEVVCAGHCLPIMNMPWYAEFVKTVAKTKLKDWQCVEDVVRKKRVKLLCKNGKPRHYRIKVVKSCKCKKITNKHNRTSQKKKRRKDQTSKTTIGS